ncbi:restriction endonuclease subunit S [Salmonella enterica subsp. enterica]|nr:restriction endonuclease subunit S [Salmonella enterica subsp. enterica]
MSGLMPKEWILGKASDFVVSPKNDIVDGPFGSNLKASEYQLSGTPIIRLQNIKRLHFINKNIKYVSNEKAVELSRHSYKKGDIVITKLGDPLGLACIIPENFQDGIIVADLVRLRINDLAFDKRYLTYLLNSPLVISQLNKHIKGTTRPRINLGIIRDLNLPIASISEQKVIAEKLDTLLAQVDSTKARLEQIPQILKRFRQAVLAAAMRGELTEIWRARNSFNLSLQKYYELTKGQKLKAKNISEPCEEKTWLRCNIGHIFNVKSGDGLTAKEMNASGDIPVYGGNGITGYHDKYNTEEPIIVIGRVGYYCGSVHLTPEKSWITDNALLVDFNRELIAKQFAYWLLKATNLRVDTSSSAQPVISGTKIYSIEIVIPPIEEQHEIVRRVEQLFAYADTIEKQVNNALTRVNSLTQSILAKAFRGELTAQWRAENPDLIRGENSAAALLEKIKAERAASGGKKTSRKKA